MQQPTLTSDIKSSTQKFPTGFHWGVATAAYQIEGAAGEGGREPSIWDTFSRIPGNTFNGATGDVACDHYHRFQEDIDLMQSLGVTDYRLSISWSRLLSGSKPQSRGSGFLSQAARRACQKAGITPWVTLYHWDLPQWLEDAGGWPARETAQRFADYAAAAHAALGDLASNWITVNEPVNSSLLGYAAGIHAPGIKSPLAGPGGSPPPPSRARPGHTSDKGGGLRGKVGPAFLLTPVHPATSTAVRPGRGCEAGRSPQPALPGSRFPRRLSSRSARGRRAIWVLRRQSRMATSRSSEHRSISSGSTTTSGWSSVPSHQGSGPSFDWRRDAWVGCEDVYPRGGRRSEDRDGVGDLPGRTERGFDPSARDYTPGAPLHN